MHEYETIFILQPDLPVTRHEKILEKVQKILNDNKAEVILQKDWGKRKLAYRLHKFLFGHYFYFNYKGTGQFINELERTLKYEEDVVRFLTVKLPDMMESEKGGKSKKVIQPEEMKFTFEENARPTRDWDRNRGGGRGHEGAAVVEEIDEEIIEGDSNA